MSKRGKNRFRQWMVRFLLLFSVVMLISLKLWIHFQVDLLMRDIRSLEVQKNQLLSEREKINAQVKRLQNIDRIGRLAKEKLSLVNDPEPLQTIRLEDFEQLDHLKEKFAAKQSKAEKDYNLAGIK